MTTEVRPARAAVLPLLAGAALLLVAVAASLAVGAGDVGPRDVLAAVLGGGTLEQVLVVRDLRLPRTLLAVAVGAALGVAGLLVQTVTRNPLAEPGLLGVTGGAGFAITVGAFAGIAGAPGVQLALAVVGALAAAALVFAVGGSSPLRLVLAGLATTWVLSGLSLALRLADPVAFEGFRTWTVGSLAGREQAPLTLPLVVVGVGLVAIVPQLRGLGALGLGDGVARALGARVERVRIVALATVVVLTAGATAAVGPIAFVGLMVPLVARGIARGSLPVALATSLLVGPAVLVVADVLSRVLLVTGEVPVAVVTAFVGGPALVWAVRRFTAGARG